MKLVLVLASLTLAVPAFAGSQQNKMKECNVQAKGMKGAERSTFMKKCLSNSPMAESTETKSAADAAAAPVAKSADPKVRMKECNMQAKGKKGDERKSFMSSCLKNDAAAPAKM